MRSSLLARKLIKEDTHCRCSLAPTAGDSSEILGRVQQKSLQCIGVVGVPLYREKPSMMR